MCVCVCVCVCVCICVYIHTHTHTHTHTHIYTYIYIYIYGINAYHMPGSILGTGNKSMNKTNPWPHEVYVLVWKAHKQICNIMSYLLNTRRKSKAGEEDTARQVLLFNRLVRKGLSNKTALGRNLTDVRQKVPWVSGRKAFQAKKTKSSSAWKRNMAGAQRARGG